MSKRGRKPKYCCAPCRQKAYRNWQFHLKETYRKALRNPLKNFIHKSIEWYTPAEYIRLVHAVLGDIELDPASSQLANQTVQAQWYFDKETNGLLQTWHARSLFLNPPHDRLNRITPWIVKLLDEYHAGHVGEALLLVDAATDTKWFARLYDHPICFVSGRINFVNGNGIPCKGQIQGSVFVYFGSRVDTFVRVFGDIGRIYVPEVQGRGDGL